MSEKTKSCIRRSCTCFYHPTEEIPPLLQMAGTYLKSDQIPIWFIAVQCVVCFLMWYITIFSICLDASKGILRWWLIYFTNLTQITCTITVTVRLFSTYCIVKTYGFVNEKLRMNVDELSPRMRSLFWTQTILTEMALPLVTLVAINYWAFVFRGSWSSVVQGFSSVQVHGVNALLLWTDYLLSAEGVYYKSFIWSFLFGTVYQIWNIIFEAAGWKNEHGDPWIYKATDWSEGWVVPSQNYMLSTFVLFALSLLAAFLKDLVYKSHETRSKGYLSAVNVTKQLSINMEQNSAAKDDGQADENEMI